MYGFKNRKLIFQNYSAVFLSLLFSLFFPAVLYASNEPTQSDLPVVAELQKSTEVLSVFKKSYNLVYQYVNDHEHFFVPLSAAVTGGAGCGVLCAAIGGALGAVDELSIYFKITDKHYLTWGIFGLAMSHSIKPSLTSDVAGIAVGILLPTGAISNYKKFIAPVISAAIGGSIAGAPGTLAGGLLGVVDETNIHNGYTDKHDFTLGVMGIAVANLLGWSDSIISGFAGMMLGSIAASYEKDVLANFLAPIKTAGDLHDTYSKFIPKEQLNAHIEKQTLSLLGGQFFTQFLSLRLVDHYQTTTYNFERLDNINGPEWNRFKAGAINFAMFIFPYVIGKTVSSSIDDYFNKKLRFALEDKMLSGLFFSETVLRLSHDHSSTALIDNLKTDASIIADSGSKLITSAISDSTAGLCGLGIIIVSSPDIAMYSALYNRVSSFISVYLADKKSNYDKEIKFLDSSLTSTMKHNAENIRAIIERDGTDTEEKKIQQIYSDLRKQEVTQSLWSTASSVWVDMSKVADYIFNYYLIGGGIKQNKVPFESRGKLQAAIGGFSNSLSWKGSNAREIASVDQSLERVVILEGKIHAKINSADQINRIIQDGDQLILRNLEIGIKDKVLVKAEDIRFDVGKTYVLTGNTGDGKTSLLSKIKGIKENGIYGNGYIYYPRANGKDPKIVMLGQQDYFPLDSSLQEVISYPDKIAGDKKLNDDNREEIKLLLKEIGLPGFDGKENIDILDLDAKKDWRTLSGGEKKKVMLVSAIIKRPNILILDETFNGLDEEPDDSSKSSIEMAQQMLKKHLPSSLILVVDHSAKHHNYNNFYDKEAHFSNKTLVIKQFIASTE